MKYGILFIVLCLLWGHICYHNLLYWSFPGAAYLVPGIGILLFLAAGVIGVVEALLWWTPLPEHTHNENMSE